jgi:anti-sigma regulatory factor (Ser/Thr protein kinase)
MDDPSLAPEDALALLLLERGSVSSVELVRLTGLTRQALHAHLQRWVREGRLVREGRGRATRYRRPGGPSRERSYATAGLEEDQVWLELRAWLEDHDVDLTSQAQAALQYVVSEMLNNAIDHSGAAEVVLRASVDRGRITCEVVDRGIGALENLRSKLRLEDHLHALQELSKGKTTTDPQRHTGEGIFFSSKMVDRFELQSSGITWIVDREREDQAVRQSEPRPGTRVRFQLSLTTKIDPQSVFERYTTDLVFDTTRCVIRLFEHGVSFVSRSEAKRLVQGLDRFRHVILDFTDVETVGQGFVDEVFRVWAREHPEVRLEPIHMSPAVEFMVRRGLPA